MGLHYKGDNGRCSDPPEHLTETGDAVIVGGLKWSPKGDFILINCGEINVAKRERGRKAGVQKGNSRQLDQTSLCMEGCKGF